MRRGAIVITSIAMAVVAEAAGAQTMQQTRLVDSGGAYVWMDGSYQSVGLPSVANFGVQGLLPPALVVPGGSEKHDPRLSGYGAGGGIGYAFAHGVFSPLWGSDVRIELGGSYIRADGASLSQSVPVTNVNLTALSMTGAVVGVAGCGGVTCFSQSVLSSDYAAWNIHLKGKSDFRSGQWIVTPSMALIAGQGETSQHLVQQTFANGAPYPLLGYGMNAALNWTDVGARIGLDTRYDFLNGFSAGLIGSIGVAHRSAAMSADSSILFSSVVPKLSAIQDSRSSAPVLANLEARLTARLMPNITAKGFAGVNYDSSTPGIESPQGSLLSPTGTPARIKFDPTVSYYAGAGLNVSFGP